MGKRQIDKLRQRFVFSAMISFTIVVLLIGFAINATIVGLNRAQIRKTLDHIIEHDNSVKLGKSEITDNTGIFQYNPFNVQLMSNVTYFKVEFDSENKEPVLKMTNIYDYSESDILYSAKELLKNKSNYGVDGIYCYEKKVLPDGRIALAAVNYMETLNSCRRLLYLTTLFGIFVLFILFFLVRHFSYIAVRPEIESDRKQKEFITNASHELKTPLAVIKADIEFLEMLNGENEWTKAIMNQTDRMNGLIQNLVMIARGDEAEEEAVTDVNLSKIISETIEPFMGLAEREKKKVIMHVESNVTLRYEANQIRMLTSILVDNAIKYCDDKGNIEITLSQKKAGRPAMFTISNSYEEGKNVDYAKFFERFYRQDESHKIEGKGGYGIGLSVAESICRKNGGDINVSWKEGVITFTCMLKGERKRL